MAIKTPAHSESASRVFVTLLRDADKAAAAGDRGKADELISAAQIIKIRFELRSEFVQNEMGDWRPSDVATLELLESALHGL